MHVDVDPSDRHLEKQMNLRAALLDGGDTVGLLNRVGDRPIAHDPAIDEHVLWSPHRTLFGQLRDESAHTNPRGILLHPYEIGPLAVDLIKPFVERTRRRRFENRSNSAL